MQFTYACYLFLVMLRIVPRTFQHRPVFYHEALSHPCSSSSSSSFSLVETGSLCVSLATSELLSYRVVLPCLTLFFIFCESHKLPRLALNLLYSPGRLRIWDSLVSVSWVAVILGKYYYVWFPGIFCLVYQYWENFRIYAINLGI